MKKIFLYPAKNLVLVIPIVLLLGFLTGLLVNTAFFKNWILVITFLMIYPTMIGFKIKEAVDLSHMKPLLIALAANFVAIPAVAWLMGRLLLGSQPDLFVGLIMISLFPTSGMTISWTMLSKGNVAAAIKITAISLLLGSFLAPWYLYLFVGSLIEVNILQTFLTIALVVVLPMIAGSVTFMLIRRRTSQEQFNQSIKPYFPAASTWFLLLLIFASISMKAKSILSDPGKLLYMILVISVFYGFNFVFSTLVARRFLTVKDGFAFVYATVLRNLSIALGIAVSAFGPGTALIVTLAFIIQVQGAAWYGKLATANGWLSSRSPAAPKVNPEVIREA
ncbi:MAG: arsenic resistance protein [Eubacteriales bacterium]|nr:arsenic resistance protein [Eubacteriales bacterium]